MIKAPVVVYQTNSLEEALVSKEYRAAVKAAIYDVVPPERSLLLHWSAATYPTVSNVELLADLPVIGLW